MDKDSNLSILPDRALSAGYLVNWAARLYAREMDAALAPLGMTSACLPVIFALGEGAALTQRELAALASVEQPTMASTLARMERDGLVERKAHPTDKRSALVSLTETARARVPAVAEAVRAINARSLEGIDPPDAQALTALLTRVIGNLRAG